MCGLNDWLVVEFRFENLIVPGSHFGDAWQLLILLVCEFDVFFGNRHHYARIKTSAGFHVDQVNAFELVGLYAFT